MSCFADAFTQMNNEPQIYGYMVLVMVSIAFFNFSGVSITKYMSATTRKVLDTLRTMVIWICQMLLHQVMRIMMMISAANRLIDEVVQSRRRPLL